MLENTTGNENLDIESGQLITTNQAQAPVRSSSKKTFGDLPPHVLRRIFALLHLMNIRGYGNETVMSVYKTITIINELDARFNATLRVAPMIAFREEPNQYIPALFPRAHCNHYLSVNNQSKQFFLNGFYSVYKNYPGEFITEMNHRWALLHYARIYNDSKLANTLLKIITDVLPKLNDNNLFDKIGLDKKYFFTKIKPIYQLAKSSGVEVSFLRVLHSYGLHLYDPDMTDEKIDEVFHSLYPERGAVESPFKSPKSFALYFKAQGELAKSSQSPLISDNMAYWSAYFSHLKKQGTYPFTRTKMYSIISESLAQPQWMDQVYGSEDINTPLALLQLLISQEGNRLKQEQDHYNAPLMRKVRKQLAFIRTADLRDMNNQINAVTVALYFVIMIPLWMLMNQFEDEGQKWCSDTVEIYEPCVFSSDKRQDNMRVPICVDPHYFITDNCTLPGFSERLSQGEDLNISSTLVMLFTLFLTFGLAAAMIVPIGERNENEIFGFGMSQRIVFSLFQSLCACLEKGIGAYVANTHTEQKENVTHAIHTIHQRLSRVITSGKESEFLKQDEDLNTITVDELTLDKLLQAYEHGSAAVEAYMAAYPNLRAEDHLSMDEVKDLIGLFNYKRTLTFMYHPNNANRAREVDIEMNSVSANQTVVPESPSL